MLAINKSKESGTYGYYKINGVDKGEWLKSLNGVLPADVVGVLNDDDPLCEKLSGSLMPFEPVMENGNIVDIMELEIDVRVTEEIQTTQLFQNLANTDYKVIKNMEVIMLELQKEYNIELPYEPNDLHETRQEWRDGIGRAESVILERDFGR